jgi:hypothetical protein
MVSENPGHSRVLGWLVTGFIFDKPSVVRGPQRELFDITPLQVPTPFLEHHGDEAIFRTMNAQDIL